MFKKILYPLDLSQASKKIFPYVKEILEKFDAEVHLLYVVHVAQYYANIEMSAPNMLAFEEDIKIGAQKRMEAFISEYFSGVPVRSKILSGKPGEEIVEYTKNNGIDLIIMGHNSTGLERAVLGSVAGHTVKYSPVPVLVISPSLLNQ